MHEVPPQDRASSTGRAAASKAEGSRFDPVVRCQTSRRSQAAEGTWLQTRRRKPASVRIGPSSPGLVRSVDRAVGFYPMGRPFESVTRHQFTSPIAQLAERLAVNQEVRGSKPRRGASSSSLISRSSVAEHRLDKAKVDGSFPSAGTRSSRCGAAGRAPVSGARGHRFETCHRDQQPACAWVWP